MAGPLARLWILTLGLLVGASLLPAPWPRPDLVLLLLVPTALRGGRVAGAWYGFGAGLLLGLVGPGASGLFAGVYGLAGVLLGALGEEEGTEGLFMHVLALAIGTVLVGLFLAAASGAAPHLGAPAVPILRDWLPRTLAMNLLLLGPARVLGRLVAGERAFRRRVLEL